MKKSKDKLRMWQERFGAADSAYSAELSKMDEREELYRGKRTIEPIVDWEEPIKATHIHNIVAENIESIVDSNIPQPKVTPRNREDEGLAKMIEDMLRNEIERLPMLAYNDQSERTVPIQGGVLWLAEWDSTIRTHNTVGETALTLIHPKQIRPQPGVFRVEDMDYIFILLPQTKAYIQHRYGVDVSDEAESNPEIKSPDSTETAEDVVTQITAYYRNDSGGIGIYSWVNDIELEDNEHYQARRLKRCTVCGALEPGPDVTPMGAPTEDGSYPAQAMAELLAGNLERGESPESIVPLAGRERPKAKSTNLCPYCGSGKFETSEEEYEEVYLPRTTASGVMIPGASIRINEYGEPYEEPTRIPYYKPDVYPIVLQKNVSVFGRLLGESDVDKIADQQNTLNRLDKKINDRILKAGTRITLPNRPDFRVDPKDGDTWYVNDPSSKSLIDVYEFTGNLQYEVYWRNAVYEQARQILGVTNSYQGREETATSGKAREIMAQQSAGRLESKRIMKNEAYGKLFELLFKLRLAYADEPRPVVGKDSAGHNKYTEFDRYAFLKQDEAGEYYWEDRFIFSCDNSSSLASNREKMWQECTSHLQAGAYGNPAELATLILYWRKMEELHYPGAGETKEALEERLKQQEMMMAEQTAMQQAAMAAQNATTGMI